MTPHHDCLASSVSPSTFRATSGHKDNRHALPLPKGERADNCGWNAGPKEITAKEIGEAMIGREVARDTFLDGQRRERLLKEQTEDLIARLERVGIDGRTYGRETAIVGLVTGQAVRVHPFRNCNMLPAPQSRNVHDMLKSVRYLFDVTKRGRLRMLVVSGGWVPLHRYRACHKAHTRLMSKFAAHPKLKDLGIDVEFYNVENTIQRDDDDTAMLNLHSHVLFKCRRHLGAKRWREFLDFARGYFPKGYVHDSPVQNPAEVVKYVFKPQEFDALTDEELGELFLQIAGGRPKIDPETGEVAMRIGPDGELTEIRERGLKFFHPLGSLRIFRRKLRENRQKLVLVPTVDDRWIWRVTERKDAQERPEPSDSQPEDNRVLAITRPMPKFTRRMEPCLIVQNYDGDFEDLIRRNRLQDTVTDARAIFRARVDTDRRAAKGDAPMRHTTTTTVPERDRPPDPNPSTGDPDGWDFGQSDLNSRTQGTGNFPGTEETCPGMSPGPYPGMSRGNSPVSLN